MSYIKNKWINDETELSAENLNYLEDGIYENQNIEIIAISDEEPTQFIKGDRYYNTNDKKIHVADNYEWNEVEDPIRGAFYILIKEQSTYYFDGNDMVSVGGGTEDIIISEEEPEEGLIWINNGDIQEINSEVVNSLEGNETRLAPSVAAVNNKVNKLGKKLWNGNFTTGSITVPNLSDYTVIMVNVGGCYCFGSKQYGSGGVGGYGSYSTGTYNYRFGVSGNTLSIDNINKGGSDGSKNIAVTEIIGIF